MRIVRFEKNNEIRTGALDGDSVVDLNLAFPALDKIALPGDMTALLAAGDELLDQLKQINLANSDYRTPVTQIRLLSPTINPPKIICCWVNYLSEGAQSPSEKPIFFGKFGTAIIGNGDNIVLPQSTQDVVVEPELTAVIGKAGRHISEKDALSHVAGYTIVNDVTSFNHRLVDLIGSRGPNMMAKTFDTFAPTGPAIVTRDEVADPHALRVRQWLNGELEIEANTSEAVTKLPEFISYLSTFFTLQPGDLILTGSPKPLGKLKFLSPGDQVKIEIENIGIQENAVVSE